jgi:hypothetical protein
MANLNNRTYIREIEGEIRPLSASRLKDSIIRRGQDRPTLLKFENTPIRDEVSGASAIVRGTETATFADGVSGRGLRMRPKFALDVPFSLRSRARFTIGFWLRPAWLKPAVDLETNDVSYYRMPLVNYSAISINQASNFFVPSTGFSIFEESVEGERNRLYLFMDSDDDPITIRTVDSYSVGDYHHIFIAYNGASRTINIYLDGKRVEYEFIEGSVVPAFFSRNNFTPSYLQINSSAPGFSGLVRNNFGTIDEFYYINRYEGSSETVARHINFGSEFVIFGGLSNNDQTTAMFAFDDPTSLDLTSVFSNGTNIYAGRSDGRIYKGDRLLWQSRRDFSNQEEINFIRKNLLSEEAEIVIDNGSLKISQGSVRL